MICVQKLNYFPVYVGAFIRLCGADNNNFKKKTKTKRHFDRFAHKLITRNIKTKNRKKKKMIRALSSSRCIGKRSTLETVRRGFVTPAVSTSPNKLPLALYLQQHRKRTESDGFVLHSPYGRIAVPDMTIDQYVWKNLAKWKNHVAIMCSVTGRKYTYSKLRDHCSALAIRLRNDLKLEQNDVVAICMPNVPGMCALIVCVCVFS